MRTKQIGLKAFTHYEVLCEERVKRHHVMLLSQGLSHPSNHYVAKSCMTPQLIDRSLIMPVPVVRTT